MKKIILLLIVLICLGEFGFSQATDSSGADEVDTAGITDTTIKITDTTKQKGDTAATKKKAVIIVDPTVVKDCKYCVLMYNDDKDVKGGFEWGLILSPFLLLILVVWIVTKNLKDFKFNDALTENEPPKKIIKNPEYNAGVVGANASVPNLSILFPTTIEVSNIEPTLSELKEIVAAKEASVLIIDSALKTAGTQKPILDTAATAAETASTTVNDAKPALDADVVKAKTALDNVEALNPQVSADVDAAKKDFQNATKAVEDNGTAILAAKKSLDEANKAVFDNGDKIKRFTDLLPTLQSQAAAAKAIADSATKELGDNTTSTSTYRPSISRYIAFITSMIIIILVVCLSSFFIYHYIRTGCPPDFGALTMLLIALGLGVTPYITNKITTAASTNK